MIKQEKVWKINGSLEKSTKKGTEEPGDHKNSLVEWILKSRGFAEEAEGFLNPSWSQLHDPFLMKDMGKAVKRISEAVTSREDIVVFGDYDVDGITSSTLLLNVIRKLGGNAEVYIPNRFTEGYGLNREAVNQIAAEGADLLITVDCGISAADEAKCCSEAGLDLIITDHHEPGNEVPHAQALIDPKQEDCFYPYKNLAGVGVVFKLAQALFDNDFDQLSEFADFAALGTVADVVPLLGENRVLVHKGIKKLNQAPRPGITALKEASGSLDRDITAQIIAFVLGPRINAAGRMGDPQKAVSLLDTKDQATAKAIAAELEISNRERQQIEKGIYLQAKSMVERNNYDQDKIIVLYDPDWHAGVIGIVASKIVETFSRPTILITSEQEEGKGSGRSIEGFDLFKGLDHCKESLIGFGGHAQAAGLQIDTDKVGEFRNKINYYADSLLSEDDLLPYITIDAEVDLDMIDLKTVSQLLELTPFGEGNPPPVFLSKKLQVQECRTVGSSGDHLKLKVGRRESPIDAIAFSKGDLCPVIKKNTWMDFVFTMDKNSWNGRDSVQMLIRDIKSSSWNDNFALRKETGVLKNLKAQLTLIQKAKKHQEDAARSRAVSIIHVSDKDIAKAEYVVNILNKDERVLILVNSIGQARQVSLDLKTRIASEKIPKYLLSFDQEPDIKRNIMDSFSAENRGVIILVGQCDEIEKHMKLFHHIFVYYPLLYPSEKQLIEMVAEKQQGRRVSIHYLFDNDALNEYQQMIKKLIPNREILKEVYYHLRNLFPDEDSHTIKTEELRKVRTMLAHPDLHEEAFLAAVEIFSEIGLLKREVLTAGKEIKITWKQRNQEKFSLEDSDLFQWERVLDEEFSSLPNE